MLLALVFEKYIQHMCRLSILYRVTDALAHRRQCQNIHRQFCLCQGQHASDFIVNEPYSKTVWFFQAC